MDERCALSYWFPALVAAGVPVPRTVIVDMPADAQMCVVKGMSGEQPEPAEIAAYHRFADAIVAAGTEVGGPPFFLRTDHTSNKHDWSRSCYVSDSERVREHIYNICERSEMCGIVGLPYDRWAVREMLPIVPFGICSRYGNMPINREFRYFVRDGEIECIHPYWPMLALTEGGAPDGLDYDELCRMPDPEQMREIVRAAARAVPGAWSIDILETTRGWYVTDMAEAHRSFHWVPCAARRTGG